VRHLERGCDGCAGGFVGGGDKEDSLSSSSSILTASSFSSFVVFGELFQTFPYLRMYVPSNYIECPTQVCVRT